MATLTLGVHEPVHLKMLYPARPGPPTSVDEAQVRVIVEVPVALATTEVGVEGGVASIVTLVVAVLVPFAFVAVKVYVVVEVGFTVVEPMRVLVLKLPGVMATEEAFETFQERVLVTLGWMY